MGRVGWLRVVGECGGYPMAKRQLEVVTIVQGRKEGGYPLAWTTVVSFISFGTTSSIGNGPYPVAGLMSRVDLGVMAEYKDERLK